MQGAVVRELRLSLFRSRMKNDPEHMNAPDRLRPSASWCVELVASYPPAIRRAHRIHPRVLPGREVREARVVAVIHEVVDRIVAGDARAGVARGRTTAGRRSLGRRIGHSVPARGVVA